MALAPSAGVTDRPSPVARTGAPNSVRVKAGMLVPGGGRLEPTGGSGKGKWGITIFSRGVGSFPPSQSLAIRPQPTQERTMSNPKDQVRIELTPAQKANIRNATGKDAEAVELSVEELEER